MKPRRRLLVTLAALALALSPSAALAQSAGDDQYEDPFADEQTEQQADPTPTPPPVTDDPGFEDEPVEPEPTAEPTAETEGAETDDAAAPAQAEDQLPRTGAEAGFVALMGTGLLLTGVGLRLRLRDGAFTP